MKIDFEAHKVFDPDYLNEKLGFVSGVLDLLEATQMGKTCYEDSNLEWVVAEANNRVRSILEQIDKAVDEAIALNNVKKVKGKRT